MKSRTLANSFFSLIAVNCLLTLTFAVVTLATAASAATISVDGFQQEIIVSGTTTFDTTFTVNAGNVLVVGAYSDGGAYSNITFDGNVATGVVTNQRTSLSYYIPTTTETFTIASATNANNAGFYVWELANVDTSISPVSVTAGSIPSSGTITTPTDNWFLVDVLGYNPGGGSGFDLVPDANSVVVERGDELRINLIDGGLLAGGDAQLATAGTYDIGWDKDVDVGTTFNIGEIAYAFAAVEVPEPSTAILSGLGLAGICFRRRRK